MTTPAELEARLIRRIAADGPIPIAAYMAEANAVYYASHDPLGAAGDFITAPEISQMFGELIGIWIADLWQRAGAPAVHYVELGPGRGTLAADALRAMAGQHLRPAVHFVETSPPLRDLQAARIPDATWHDTIDTLPGDLPMIVVANEFFDALPCRQHIRTRDGWRERMVTHDGHGFAAIASSDLAPGEWPDAIPGSICESSPAALAIAGLLAERLVAQGGACLAIDYGHEYYTTGDTLQAVHAHAYADMFADPGGNDLTAHVDFTALGKAAARRGARISGPVSQGFFLGTLGIAARAAALGRRYPQRIEEIGAAHHRLTAEEVMGALFRAMAIVAPHWPAPAGF